MIDDIKKTLWAAFTVIAILVLGGLHKQASAEITAKCHLKKPHGSLQAGQEVRLMIKSSNGPAHVRWADEFCRYRPSIFHISGRIDNQMESDFRTLYNALKGDAYFQSIKADYSTIMFTIESEGGSVLSAIRIGRMLRDLNAMITVPGGRTCSFSCVFLLVGGVGRLVFGHVGVHRPYFESLDRRRTAAQVSADIRALDTIITTYLRDMNITSNLLDFMKGVASDEMRWLSAADLQTFGLSAPDPVFDELRTAHDAWRYGTTSAILRQRMVESERCFRGARGSSLPPGSWDCSESIKYGISVGEWRLRKQRVAGLCPSITYRTYADCERDVMIGVRR